MEPQYNDNDKNLRLKRDENSGKFTVMTFLNWWLVPGFIGMAVTVFIGRIMAVVISHMPRNEPVGRGFKHAMDNLSEDFGHLAALEWDRTNLWTYLLFGFVLGVFIKYAYSDKKNI